MGTRPVILGIVGPTASGKSALALRLAARWNAEIVSADSRQIYRHLDIGTAKPPRSDLQRIPHHFIDILEPDEDYSAGAYGRAARKIINDVIRAGRRVILVGGSGLYVKAVVDGLFDGPSRDPGLRAQLEEEARERGADGLYERLCRLDPEAASTMDSSKVRRVIRALEVHAITGRPISELHAAQNSAAPFGVRQIGLRWTRKELYRRINERVEWMLDAGLLDEVRRLQTMGFDPTLNSLNTVGYREAFAHLAGKLTREEMVAAIQQNTRRFAKRQLTWFRADRRIVWKDVHSEEEITLVADGLAAEFANPNG